MAGSLSADCEFGHKSITLKSEVDCGYLNPTVALTQLEYVVSLLRASIQRTIDLHYASGRAERHGAAG